MRYRHKNETTLKLLENSLKIRRLELEIRRFPSVSRMSGNLCISETLRVNGLQWSSDGQSSLGYSYW